MLEWERNYYAEVGTKKGTRLDPTVLTKFVLNKRHFMHLDSNGEKVRGWKKPRYTTWLTNEDFTFLLKCLGGGNNLLNTDCICLQCGLARRSWKHFTRQCNNRDRRKLPNLYKLSLSKKECLQQISNLRELSAKQTPDPLSSIELRGKYVSMLDTEDRPSTYFVTKTFTNKTSQIMDIDTLEVTMHHIHELYTNGKVCIIHRN